MGADTNPFDLPGATIQWGTVRAGDLNPDPTASEKVERALTETIDKFMMKLPYTTGEEARDWADAIQSLCAGLANLDVIN